MVSNIQSDDILLILKNYFNILKINIVSLTYFSFNYFLYENLVNNNISEVKVALFPSLILQCIFEWIISCFLKYLGYVSYCVPFDIHLI